MRFRKIERNSDIEFQVFSLIQWYFSLYVYVEDVQLQALKKCKEKKSLTTFHPFQCLNCPFGSCTIGPI